MPIQRQLQSKYQLFEKFLSDNLILTPEFKTESEVAAYVNRYDYLISGSDQIWNTICTDFDWSYYLPFAKGNAIAYAPSMGPYPERQVHEEHFQKRRFEKDESLDTVILQEEKQLQKKKSWTDRFSKKEK